MSFHCVGFVLFCFVLLISFYFRFTCIHVFFCFRRNAQANAPKPKPSIASAYRQQPQQPQQQPKQQQPPPPGSGGDDAYALFLKDMQDMGAM